MAWTFPYLGETQELNAETRADAPGKFVQLSNGFTHYESGTPYPHPLATGEGGTAAIVLVHGFSVPYFIWDPTFEFLTQSGFRVLRYDLFGRGYSDRPKVGYDIDLFCRQLEDMLDVLGFEQVDLIGLSMGGPITASFAARHPERVGKLALVDPAGARPVTLSRVLKAATAPGFGELALGLFGSGQMAKGVVSDFYDPKNVKTFVDKYMLQMKYKGFMRAILSTIRNGMLGSFIEAFQVVGQMQTPVLLIWGRDDKTVPFEHSADLRAAIPQARFLAVDNCGHIPHYERPEIVNPVLLEFLDE